MNFAKQFFFVLTALLYISSSFSYSEPDSTEPVYSEEYSQKFDEFFNGEALSQKAHKAISEMKNGCRADVLSGLNNSYYEAGAPNPMSKNRLLPILIEACIKEKISEKHKDIIYNYMENPAPINYGLRLRVAKKLSKETDFLIQQCKNKKCLNQLIQDTIDKKEIKNKIREALTAKLLSEINERVLQDK